MKTITVKLYDFSELSPEAQQKAIANLSDINVDHEWYDSTYEDAETIGLKITGFDIDRASYCKGEFITSATEAANAILVNHGEACETYKDAKSFLAEYDALVAKYSDGKDLTRVAEDNEYDFDSEADALEYDFLKTLLEDYRIILSNEWDYLTSDKAIIETIEANDYTFEADGTMNNG